MVNRFRVRSINTKEIIGYIDLSLPNIYTQDTYQDVYVEQSTGLFDKFGKEIYEGDILYSEYNRLRGPILKQEILVNYEGDHHSIQVMMWNDGKWNEPFDPDAHGKTTRYIIVET